jgi:hypothetical protein
VQAELTKKEVSKPPARKVRALPRRRPRRAASLVARSRRRVVAWPHLAEPDVRRMQSIATRPMRRTAARPMLGGQAERPGCGAGPARVGERDDEGRAEPAALAAPR